MPVKSKLASSVKPTDPLQQGNRAANISLVLGVGEILYIGFLFTIMGDLIKLYPQIFLVPFGILLVPIIVGGIIIGMGTDGMKRANGYINDHQRLIPPVGGAWKAYIAVICGYAGLLLGLFLAFIAIVAAFINHVSLPNIRVH